MPVEARLVRFKCVCVDDETQGDCIDQLVFDAFIDTESRIVNDQEMLGYEVIYVGPRKETQVGLLRLQPDLSYLCEELVTDGTGGKTKQITHEGALSDTIQVKLGAEFEVHFEGNYTYKIVEIVDLVAMDQKRVAP